MTEDPSPKLCDCGCGEPAPIATRTYARWGHVEGQPMRFVVGHNLRRGPAQETPLLCACGCGGWTNVQGKLARTFIRGHYSRLQGYMFDERWRLDEQTGCHIWTGTIRQGGYGVFGDRLAHRIAWERDRGPIPAGLELDHLCRNRACINVCHLEPVTTAENVRRGKRTKLTVEDVLAIRASTESHASLGRLYGVTPTNIKAIRMRFTWRDV